MPVPERMTERPEPPPRPDEGHKGTFGRLLLIAGSRGMSGAAILAGQGALRGGAGLVSIAVPRSIQSIVAASEPSYLTIPLEDDAEGRLTTASLETIQTSVEGKNAVGLGPGLGQSLGVQRIVHDLYQRCDIPLVVDADALNALAEDVSLLSQYAGPRILTPHPGEFSRLTNQSAPASEEREERAVAFARSHQVVLVLKGARSVVTDGERVYINTTGNSGMATGGTGDVLTGVLTALLAQGMEPFAAAQLGVYLHGLAGDLAAEELSRPGLIASDLPRFLCHAWQQMLNGNAERHG